MPRRSISRLVATSAVGLLALTACSAEPELDADQRRAQDVSLIFMTAVIDEDASAACAVTAINDLPVRDEPEWEKACVQGVEGSNKSDGRRDAYQEQVDAGASVSEVTDDRATVTWDENRETGADPTVHTMQKIDDSWYVRQ